MTGVHMFLGEAETVAVTVIRDPNAKITTTAPLTS